MIFSRVLLLLLLFLGDQAIAQNLNGYKLIFRQTVPYRFIRYQFTLNAEFPDAANYAVLGDIVNYWSSDGTGYHFLLRWPGDSNYYEWSQTSNPLHELIAGYRGYCEGDKSNGWGGLEPSQNALMDGSTGSYWWYYAVGAYSFLENGIPGWHTTQRKTQVELYIRIPTFWPLQINGYCPTYTTNLFDEPRCIYFADKICNKGFDVAANHWPGYNGGCFTFDGSNQATCKVYYNRNRLTYRWDYRHVNVCEGSPRLGASSSCGGGSSSNSGGGSTGGGSQSGTSPNANANCLDSPTKPPTSPPFSGYSWSHSGHWSSSNPTEYDYKGVTTIEGCKQFCDNNSRCLAFARHRSQQHCFNYYSSVLVNGQLTVSNIEDAYKKCVTNSNPGCRAGFNMQDHTCSSTFLKEYFNNVGSHYSIRTVLNAVNSFISSTLSVCSGNLSDVDFSAKVATDSTMQDHACDAILPTEGHISSVSFQYFGDGICTTTSKCNGLYSVALAMNDEMVDRLFTQILNIATGTGGVLSPLFDQILRTIDTKVAFGISPSGDFYRDVVYWRGGPTNENLRFKGHVFFQMINSFDLYELIAPEQQALTPDVDNNQNGGSNNNQGGNTNNNGGPNTNQQPDGTYDTQQQSIIDLFQSQLKGVLTMTGSVVQMTDLTGILDGIDGAINCIIAGHCYSDYRDNDKLMNRVLINTNFLLESSGTFTIDLSKIMKLLPKFTLNLGSSIFMKYGAGVYFKTSISQNPLLDLIDNFFWDRPNTPIDIALYVNDHSMGFKTETSIFNVECTFTYGTKDLSCKYRSEVWNVFVELIGDVVSYLNDARMWITAQAGKVIRAGGLTGFRAGNLVRNGLVIGVGLMKGVVESFWTEASHFLRGTKDWCDCNQRGTLKVRSMQSGETFDVEEMTEDVLQRITFSVVTREVRWKTAGMAAEQRSYFRDAGKIWGIRYFVDNKPMCGGCRRLRCFTSQPTGRIIWETDVDNLGVSAEEAAAAQAELEAEEEASVSQMNMDGGEMMDMSMQWGPCDKPDEHCPVCKNDFRMCQNMNIDECSKGEWNREPEDWEIEECINNKCGDTYASDAMCKHNNCHGKYIKLPGKTCGWGGDDCPADYIARSGSVSGISRNDVSSCAEICQNDQTCDGFVWKNNQCHFRTLATCNVLDYEDRDCYQTNVNYWMYEDELDSNGDCDSLYNEMIMCTINSGMGKGCSRDRANQLASQLEQCFAQSSEASTEVDVGTSKQVLEPEISEAISRSKVLYFAAVFGGFAVLAVIILYHGRRKAENTYETLLENNEEL